MSANKYKHRNNTSDNENTSKSSNSFTLFQKVKPDLYLLE